MNIPRSILSFLLTLLFLFFGMSVFSTELIKVENVSEKPDRETIDILIGELVPLPAGCFMMGSPEDEQDRFPREKQTQKCMDSFLIGKFEITNIQYVTFLNNLTEKPESFYNSTKNGGHHIKDRLSRILETKDGYAVESGYENFPAVGIAWYGAHAYTVALSNWTEMVYRLPDEDEWEYAARGGTNERFYWGNDPDYSEICKYANVADLSYKLAVPSANTANCNDGHVFISEVGSFEPNSFGLYDMVGNVWEWNCSKWESLEGESSFECVNEAEPEEWVSGRSGSWDFHPIAGRSAYRGADHPGNGHHHDGFRIIHIPDPLLAFKIEETPSLTSLHHP